MKKLFLLILVSLSICVGYSQQVMCVGSSDVDYNARLQAGLIGFEYVNPVKGFEGDQYFNNWTFGDVLLEDGDLIKDVTLRYDEYLDQLLWLRRSDYRTGILSKAGVAGFKLYNANSRNELIASFIKTRINLPLLDSALVFLQVLVSGDISLYVYRNMNVISTHENKLNDNTRYLIISGDKQYPLLLNRHSLLTVPAIDKAAMKTVLRSSGITLAKNEQGLIRAVSLYNEKHKK